MRYKTRRLFTLVVMVTFNKTSRQNLLRILFFVCEAALVTSFVANEILWHKYHHAAAGAPAIFGFTFLISLAALLVVCFCLRRIERLLATIGWITAFILFWYAALSIEL
jgi:hypothetical protein